MALFPLAGHPQPRSRDERGVAFPSPVVMLSVIAVAMAAITFVATRDEAPTERRVDTASIASADPTATATPTPTQRVTPKPKPKPRLVRGEVYVEVYNNSGIKGLAAGTAARATQVGWALGHAAFTDQQMADYLAPWEPQRGRVAHLLRGVGMSRPRRGPRMAPRTHLPVRRN